MSKKGNKEAASARTSKGSAPGGEQALGNRIVESGNSSTELIHDQSKRIPYGNEADAGPCPECGAQKGEYHDDGCLLEKCPDCGGIGMCSGNNGGELQKFITHLEYHGFEVSHDGDNPEMLGLTAPSGLPVIVCNAPTCLALIVIFPLREDKTALNHRALSLANRFNHEALQSRFHITDDGCFRTDSVFLGAYDRQTFNHFLQEWLKCVMVPIQESVEELKTLFIV